MNAHFELDGWRLEDWVYDKISMSAAIGGGGLRGLIGIFIGKKKNDMIKQQSKPLIINLKRRNLGLANTIAINQ
jgi:hypothetical protein